MRTLTESDLKIRRHDPEFPGIMETLMVPFETWDTCGCPAEVVAHAKEATEEGIPTGIAKHPVLGWHIVMAGQGPYIEWAEGDEIPKKKEIVYEW